MLLPVRANCCARVGVSTETRGVMANPVPEPVSATACGVPGALSAIDSVAFRAPVVEGVNVTVMVHVWAGASAALHVLVCAKSPALAPVNGH